jgi:hypothetical protein
MSGGDDQTANWVDNLEAYMSYRNQLEAMFDGQGETSNTLVSGLSDFLSNPEQAIGQTQYPLLECVCGTLVDINAIADERSSHFTTGSKCRHCQRSILNLKMEVMGLGCRQEIEGETCHPLCPCDSKKTAQGGFLSFGLGGRIIDKLSIKK